MTTKVCFKCGEEKDLSAYYKHKQMADGHLNKCKSCTKSDAKNRESTLREYPNWVESEKRRHREKYHRLGYKEKHKPTPEKKAESTSRYKNKYPEKTKAKAASQRMTIKGKEMHHWSYNEEHYKDVIPLTTDTHNLLHRFMEYDQTEYKYRATKNVGTFSCGQLLDTKYRHIKYYLLCVEDFKLH